MSPNKSIAKDGAIVWMPVIGALVILTLLVVLSVERRIDVDLNSGRLRHRVCIGPVPLYDEFEETRFSQLIWDQGREQRAAWGHVLSVGLMRTHGRYGFGVTEMKRFMIVCEHARIDHERQVEYAHRLLELMQADKFREMQELSDSIERTDGPDKG